jgi:tetratricopeptide (TPR) repeat protein
MERIQTKRETVSKAQEIDTLNHQSYNAINSNLSEALALALKAKELAESHAYLTGRARSLALVANCLLETATDLDQAWEQAATACRLYESQSVGTPFEKADALSILGRIQFLLGEYPEAKTSFERSISIFERLGNRSDSASQMNNLANIYMRLADYAKALITYYRSLVIKEELGKTGAQAGILNNIGIVYEHLSDYAEALKAYFKALNLYQDLNHIRGQGTLYLNIANVYIELNELDRAAIYYEKSLDFSEQSGNHIGHSFATRNLGRVYQKKNKFHQAEEFYEKAIKLYRQSGNRSGIAETLTSQASLALEKKNYPASEAAFHEALGHFVALGEKRSEANTLFQYAALKSSQGNLDEAENLIFRCLHIAEDIKANLFIYESHQFLSNLYKLKGNFEGALHHHEEFFRVRNEVFSQEQSDKIANLRLSHEVAYQKKEQEITTLKKLDLATAQAQIKRLEEIVVLCAWTGKVKINDRWVKIEEYLQHQLGLSVSHGISDELAARMIEELQKTKNITDET